MSLTSRMSSVGYLASFSHDLVPMTRMRYALFRVQVELPQQNPLLHVL